eukprot:11083974-Prorocentrum_lima.AAC.1
MPIKDRVQVELNGGPEESPSQDSQDLAEDPIYNRYNNHIDVLSLTSGVPSLPFIRPTNSSPCQ